MVRPHTLSGVRMARALVRGERGTALLCALMVIALLATLGASLVMVVVTETLVGAHQRASQEALYAVEAGVERAIGELRSLPGWQSLPAPGVTSSLAELGDAALYQPFRNASIQPGWKWGIARSACRDQEFAGDALRVAPLECWQQAIHVT